MGQNHKVACPDCGRPKVKRARRCQACYFIRRRSVPLRDRFWPKVLRGLPEECWIWQSNIHVNGYGTIQIGNVPVLAHRVAYKLCVGAIPDGWQIDHLCRVRACVNPWHLEAVTPRENIMRSTNFCATNAVKTHCKHGHAFDDINTGITSEGHRRCRACARAIYHARRLRLCDEHANEAA